LRCLPNGWCVLVGSVFFLIYKSDLAKSCSTAVKEVHRGLACWLGYSGPPIYCLKSQQTASDLDSWPMLGHNAINVYIYWTKLE
jgi:hypothetical protein